MRMYLSAISKEHIGYTPDWIQLHLPNGTDLTLDIRGEIDYDANSIDCRVKGDLVPFALWDVDGEEKNFTKMTEDEINNFYPVSKIIELFKEAKSFTIGLFPTFTEIYPDDYAERIKDDEFNACKCEIEIFNANTNETFEKEFTFDVEITF